MIGRFVAGLLLTLTGLLAPAAPQLQTGAVRVTPLGAPGLMSGNGTVLLRGKLRSTLHLTLHGAFSVGHAHNLSWDLLRASNLKVRGYREKVIAEHFRFNIHPQSREDLTEDGVPVRRFTWTDPPANTVIRVTVKRTLHVATPLRTFYTHASYPLSSVPSDFQPYLKVTPSLNLSASQRSLVHRLVGPRRSERNVVNRVANWVASHLHYDASLAGGPYNASWVLSNRRGTCQGYASLMAGMLRVLGIPSQVVYGWVSPRPLTVRSRGSYQTVSWAPGTNGAFHDWLNVYFPGAGWVAFDPQREKFFVDTRHYALLTAVDASDPVLGAYMADPMGNDAVTGRLLKNGGPEAVPEDGSLASQAREHDTAAMHVSSIVHDVHALTLFAR